MTVEHREEKQSHCQKRIQSYDQEDLHWGEHRHQNRSVTSDTWPRHLQFPAHTTHWLLWTPEKSSCTHSTISADEPSPPVRFAVHRQPLFRNFLYHSWTALSTGGPVWYLVQNIHCTITIDSVLANSKIQSTSLSPVLAMFHHDWPQVVKPASTHGAYYPNKLGEILCLSICSFLLCLFQLLRCQVRKFRRNLWITLYYLRHTSKGTSCYGNSIFSCF
jgi:hypothetical protein